MLLRFLFILVFEKTKVFKKKKIRRPIKNHFPPKPPQWSPDETPIESALTHRCCVEKWTVKLDLRQVSLLISEASNYFPINRAILLSISRRRICGSWRAASALHCGGFGGNIYIFYGAAFILLKTCFFLSKTRINRNHNKMYGHTFSENRPCFSLLALKAQSSRPSWTVRTSFLPQACWLFWDHGEQTRTSICDTLGKAPTTFEQEVQTCRGSPRMTERPCRSMIMCSHTQLVHTHRGCVYIRISTMKF